MKKSRKYLRQKPARKRNSSKAVIVLSCIAAALLVLLVVMLLLIPRGDDVPMETTTVPTTVPTTAQTIVPTETTVPPTTVPEETMSMMMENLHELHNVNPDLAGWLKIEGTVVDYPVMYTPEEHDKYLYKDFKGNKDLCGSLYIEENCNLDPESYNLIIYGHNMNNGSMFRTLLSYADEEFWKEHPIIEFSTLDQEREYEIVAAFYDRIYYSHEDVFKFYFFYDAATRADFDEAMDYFAEKALYDTGVVTEYGDDMITLVTCSHHHQHGRFVVVARAINQEARDALAEQETE